MVELNQGIFKSFVVTGLYYNSLKRFRKEYAGSFGGYYAALGTNLWRGSVWGVKPNGKRQLIKRVF